MSLVYAAHTTGISHDVAGLDQATRELFFRNYRVREEALRSTKFMYSSNRTDILRKLNHTIPIPSSEYRVSIYPSAIKITSYSLRFSTKDMNISSYYRICYPNGSSYNVEILRPVNINSQTKQVIELRRLRLARSSQTSCLVSQRKRVLKRRRSTESCFNQNTLCRSGCRCSNNRQ